MPLLVTSRNLGEFVVVEKDQDHYILFVLRLGASSVRMLVHSVVGSKSQSVQTIADKQRYESMQIGDGISLRVLKIRHRFAILGIIAPEGWSVRTIEQSDDQDPGTAGAPMPNPIPPKLPSLRASLAEPLSD